MITITYTLQLHSRSRSCSYSKRDMINVLKKNGFPEQGEIMYPQKDSFQFIQKFTKTFYSRDEAIKFRTMFESDLRSLDRNIFYVIDIQK